MSASVGFFFGLGSRYSYLASTQITALESETGCRVQWFPMISGDLMNRCGQNPFAERDAQGNWSGVSVSGQYNEQYRLKDLARWAALYGVSYNEPIRPQMSAIRRTLYCVAAEMEGAAAAYCRTMFSAMYADTISICEEDCRRFAVQMGLSAETLCNHVESGAAQARQDEIVALALKSNVFGVPSFVVDGELFWGNDRLGLLRHHLKHPPC